MAQNKPTMKKTPEEILKEIEKLKSAYAEAEQSLKEAKRESISQAVAKAGADFEERYKVYINKRNNITTKQAQIDKLRGEIQADMQHVRDQYKIVRDTLVGAGAKEEYLTEFLGEPPAEKAVKTAPSGTTGTKVRTRAKLPDGTTLSWTELLSKHGIAHKDGQSAHREWDAAVAANPNLPKVEVVT